MKKFILILISLLTLFVQPVFSEVITTNHTEGYVDYVYVAGSPDAYPMEYYDKETKSYRGILPDLLANVSEHTGLNFVYINGDQKDKHQLSKNSQVDMITAIGAREFEVTGKDSIDLFSYHQNGKVLKASFVFTQMLDDETIARIKEAATEITATRRNGIFLSYAAQKTQTHYIWFILAGLFFVCLVAFVIYFMIRIKRLQKERAIDKMTDNETGMGNLQFFKHHFRYTISEVSKSLYHIAYIVLDSSYLRSYHGDASFEDVLSYTATVLREYTGDREISARITENGFAFAFQSTSEDDAKNRLKEIMNKLNAYDDMKEKNNKVVFHAAAYHLLSSDKNSEILLFNLRKNCNKILGTNQEIIYCDIHSMNVVQEEKKLTESILKGFENNEFKMYLQFIVDNKTKKIALAEALSRWDSSEKGLISPGKYIESMEAAGLISRHDFNMFEQVCRQLEVWSETEYKDISISCNFTRITLSEDNFIDKLNMIANSYRFDKSKLSVEITEDAMEMDTEVATQNVKKCKEIGFRVYLDDLGSGYTSLVNLCDYPIDIVKIDRDILLKANTPKGFELFSGVIALAHNLNIKVICEGVETEEQVAIVSQSDCDYIQGWYYSKPLPLEECETFIGRFGEK